MMVEALWRNAKRQALHNYNRPRLDLANFVIFTKVLPSYRITLSNLLFGRGGGRPGTLTHMQKAFRESWLRLKRVPIKGSYQTDLTRWTCDCGAQKYHANLLCKHLVQAVGKVRKSWWYSIVRHHAPAFYNLPSSVQRGLQPMDSRRTFPAASSTPPSSPAPVRMFALFNTVTR